MARGLQLNDSLQVVLARHDAIASGVSLPMLQAPETSSVLKTANGDAASLDSDSESSSSSNENETDEGEQLQNDFIQLAKRFFISHSLTDSHHTLVFASDKRNIVYISAATLC